MGTIQREIVKLWLVLSALFVTVSARDPITFIVFMALGLLSYQPMDSPLTQNADIECYTDPTGKDYRGNVALTISGLPCQTWTSLSPHIHLYLPSLYPTAGLGDHDYCRNPDGQSSPWCYTTDSYYRWDYCHVGFPSDLCNVTPTDEDSSSSSLLIFLDYLRIIFAISLPYLGGILASSITPISKPGWSRKLRKPAILPPSWVLGPLWTYLYISMGYSSYLIWKHAGGFCQATALPFGLYGASLILNWLWAPVFFGFKQLGLATAVIILYLMTATVKTYIFWSIHETAGYLLCPLIGWLSLASVFSFCTWQFNRGHPGPTRFNKTKADMC